MPALLAYGAGRVLRNLAVLLPLFALPGWAEPATVVALGDSLTQGYGLPPGEGLVPQLNAWLADHGADAVVLNAGVSGDTTAGGLARLDWSLTPETDALIVTLGGNDMLRGIAPETARSNLDAILAGAEARRLPVLLVGLRAPGNYGADYKRAFDAIYPDLAAAHNASLMPDIFAPLASLPDRETALETYMQGDGIHPNAKGVALIVEAMGPYILDLLKDAD